MSSTNSTLLLFARRCEELNTEQLTLPDHVSLVHEKNEIKVFI